MIISVHSYVSIYRYFCDTVGKNEKVIREYIQTQLQEDKLYDQMSMKEFIDPFTGKPVKGSKK